MLVGGDARFKIAPRTLSGDDLAKWHDDNDRQQAEARREAQKLMNEHEFARLLINYYLDFKDWGRRGPEMQTEYYQKAFSIIRDNSAGLLGNPPLM